MELSARLRLPAVLLGLALGSGPVAGEASAPVPLAVRFEAPQMQAAYDPQPWSAFVRDFELGVPGLLSDTFDHWTFALGGANDDDSPWLEVAVFNVGTSERIDVEVVPHDAVACAPRWPSTWRTAESVANYGHEDLPESLDSLVASLTALLETFREDIRSCLVDNAPIARRAAWLGLDRLVVPLDHRKHYRRLTREGMQLKVVCEGPCPYELPWLSSVLLREAVPYPPGSADPLQALAAEPRYRVCGDLPPLPFEQVPARERRQLTPGEVFLLSAPAPRHGGALPADVYSPPGGSP